jgi:hypothetical protein
MGICQSAQQPHVNEWCSPFSLSDIADKSYRYMIVRAKRGGPHEGLLRGGKSTAPSVLDNTVRWPHLHDGDSHQQLLQLPQQALHLLQHVAIHAQRHHRLAVQLTYGAAADKALSVYLSVCPSARPPACLPASHSIVFVRLHAWHLRIHAPPSESLRALMRSPKP